MLRWADASAAAGHSRRPERPRARRALRLPARARPPMGAGQLREQRRRRGHRLRSFARPVQPRGQEDLRARPRSGRRRAGRRRHRDRRGLPRDQADRAARRTPRPAGTLRHPADRRGHRPLPIGPQTPLVADTLVPPIVLTTAAAPAGRRAELAEAGADVVIAGEERSTSPRARRAGRARPTAGVLRGRPAPVRRADRGRPGRPAVPDGRAAAGRGGGAPHRRGRGPARAAAAGPRVGADRRRVPDAQVPPEGSGTRT